MKYITEIIRYFTFITTGIVILFIVLMLIKGNDCILLSTLIKIPCAALATSIVTVIFYPTETKTKKEYILKVLLHYLVLCIVMTIFGVLAEWISFNFIGIMIMVISTAAVYIFTYTIAFLCSKNDADELNMALKNKRSKS